MKYGVIDIGSNSVRLIIWSDGKTLYKTLNTTRLGEGIAKTGKLSDLAMERTALAVKEFYDYSIENGADQVVAFATAAVRSAENGKEFVDRVRRYTGIDVDVISGEEEAKIGLLGAVGSKDGGIIDIGGGSTEVTVQKDKKLIYTHSLNLGAVRLLDLCQRDRLALEKVIIERLKEYEKIPNGVPMYGIGGTATSLGALSLELKEYDGDAVHGYRLTKMQLSKTVDKLFTLSPEEIVKESCLPLKRAEIIAGGALLLLRLMEYIGIDEIICCETDNLEGYIQKKLV